MVARARLQKNRDRFEPRLGRGLSRCAWPGDRSISWRRNQKKRAGCDGSISRILSEAKSLPDDHFSGMPVARHLKRPTRESSGPGRSARVPPASRRVGPRLPPYLVLLPVGFTEPGRSPDLLVSSYLTVSPLPRRTRGFAQAVCFLWHCPYPCDRAVGVTHHRALWSPDFPPRPGLGLFVTRPSAAAVIRSITTQHPSYRVRRRSQSKSEKC